MNNSVDKAYIALELTKLTINNTRGYVMDCYKSCLNDLNDLSSTEDIEKLKLENAQLEKQNRDLKKQIDLEYAENIRVRQIKQLVKDNAGNMEPSIYEQLMYLLPKDE